jgi:O-antigen ligase
LVFAVAFGVYQSLGHESLGNIPRFAALNRINATFMDPNALGSFFFLALPPIAGLIFVTRNGWARGALALLLAGALYVLGCSGSRTGMMGLVIALGTAGALFLVHEEAPDLRRHSRLLAPVLFLAIAVVAFFPAKDPSSAPGTSILSRRLALTYEAVQQRGMIGMLKTQRWPMWKRALKVTTDFPLSGIGLGAFHTEIPNFMRWGYRQPYFRDNANNFYLQTSAELGLIGLFFAAAVLGVVAREAVRLARRRFFSRGAVFLVSLLAGSLIAMAVMYLTGPHTFFAEVKLLFWLLIGMVFAQLYSAPPRVEAPEEAPARLAAPSAARFRHRVRVAVAATLVGLFLVNQSVDALTDLSLRERRRLYDWDFSRGFYTWEVGVTKDRFRWTHKEASIVVPTWLPLLHTTLFVAHPDAAKNPVRVDLLVDGKVAETEVFKHPKETRAVTLLLPRAGNEQAEVGFRVNRTFVPSQSADGSFDGRELGVLVRDFQFTDVPSATGFGFSDWQVDPAAAAFRFRVVERSAALSVNVERVTRFDLLAAAAPGPAEAAAPRLRVYANNRPIQDVTLDQTGWRKILLDLQPSAEELAVLLRFEVEGAGEALPGGAHRGVRLTELGPVNGR